MRGLTLWGWGLVTGISSEWEAGKSRAQGCILCWAAQGPAVCPWTGDLLRAEAPPGQVLEERGHRILLTEHAEKQIGPGCTHPLAGVQAKQPFWLCPDPALGSV